ncbi:MAG TPA: hypothetical protein VMF03_18215 [Steroidobacteraceae bacterium]|nr:hypothetical protein [Steroidobacteraceae bacterium]
MSEFPLRMQRSVWMGLVGFWAFACGAAASAQSVATPPAADQALPEVTVTATRESERRALSRAINGYVASHTAPNARTNQIGRWHEPVCPLVTGLEPRGRDYVTRAILDLARGVGAPTTPAGRKCPITVEIVFTREPQALLDHIAKAYRPLLGFYPAAQVKQMTTFTRPIQAWYQTGTRSMEIQLPVFQGSSDQSFGAGPGTGPPVFQGAQVDSDTTAMGMQPSGVAGSLLGHRVRSEFLHVLIIADSSKLARYTVRSVADYIAMLSLTRMSELDQCAPLPSITDLLADACAKPVADVLTAADRAYLQALYSADLEQNLNLERGEVHAQMMRRFEGK